MLNVSTIASTLELQEQRHILSWETEQGSADVLCEK